jgi:hypothetical protein
MPTAVRTTKKGAQVTNETAVRHWRFHRTQIAGSPAFADLEIGRPVQIKPTNSPVGNSFSLNGTILSLDSVTEDVVVDVTPGAIYYHNIDNVDNYTSGVADSWTQIAVGDTVYYDQSAAEDPAFLICATADSAGNAAHKFGIVVMVRGESNSDFPKSSATATQQVGAGVMQMAG